MVRVLVVDDDPAIGRLIKAVLATASMEVEQASSGEAALALLENGHGEPDLILLDLKMPGMDGSEVFREARRAGISCPIVLCSAYGATAARAELGAEGAIDKPFNPEMLISAIQSLTRDGGS